MLRITKVVEKPSLVTLKLEGRIVADWVSVLERECLRWLQEKRKVLLDFSGVRYVEGRGVEALKRIECENLQIINSPALIEDLFKGGEDQ